MPLPAPFELRTPQDAGDEQLLKDVSEYGWHIVGVEGEPDSPPFAFTIGLYYQFLQPEILIMGIDHAEAANILNSLGEAMRSGRDLTPGRYADFIDGHDIELSPIDPGHYRSYLGYAIWFYRSLGGQFPAMQCIWPDGSGVFPNEPGHDARFAKLQHLLDAPPQ